MGEKKERTGPKGLRPRKNHEGRPSPYEKLASKGGSMPLAIWTRKMNQLFGHKNASMPNSGK